MSGVLPSDRSNPESRFSTKPKEAKQVEFRWVGPIHDATTRFIMEWMEHRLDQVDSSSLQKKRLVRVAVELLQNMHHHATQGTQQSAFEISSEESMTWNLCTKNALPALKATALEKRWRTLKSLCHEELRAMQRTKIAQDDRSSHGGGGVGLNEILRKAAGRVEMNFDHHNEETYVTFTAEIPLR